MRIQSLAHGNGRTWRTATVTLFAVLGMAGAMSWTMAAAPPQAGAACTAGMAAMNGWRYVGYAEGTFAGVTNTLVAGHFDFRRSVKGGIYHRLVASPRKTAKTDNLGGGGVDVVTGCVDVAGSPSEFTLTFESGGNATFMIFDQGARVRVDGRNDPNGKGLRGWFYRALEPSAQ